VHVEDHPIDYASFQGTIPEGEYGAGAVELWDRGTWEPLDDPDDGMHKGELRFLLHGKRLNGRFTLVRLKPRPNQRSSQDNWLLIKGHDEAERRGADALSIEQQEPPPKLPRPERNDPPAPGAVRAKLPKRLAPQLASVVDKPPAGKDWISEIKFDGYRLICWIDQGKVRLMTRNELDWTDRLPAVAREVAKLNVESAILDGELVALDAKGVSSFPALQAALSDGRDATLHLFLFDLPYLDGWDLRKCTLIDRKRVLSELADWRGMLRYSDHQVGPQRCTVRPAAWAWKASCASGAMRPMRPDAAAPGSRLNAAAARSSSCSAGRLRAAPAAGSARFTWATTIRAAICTTPAASARDFPRLNWAG
jgi:bifunctional non-homologous end joining protein LigD